MLIGIHLIKCDEIFSLVFVGFGYLRVSELKHGADLCL